MPTPKNAPLYQQIYDEIKDAIEKGVYAPKERIPSELELAEQYEVSRITVRRAVEELCSDGYLVKQQGRGTFVATPHINRQFHATALQTFTELCASNGMKPGAHVIDRQIVPARQNEMEFFGLQKDALLLHIKRVRTADGEPIFEENIFVPFDEYRELLTADLEDKSIFGEVERVGGTPIVSVGYRTVEAVRANTEQAAELGIAPDFYKTKDIHVHFPEGAVPKDGPSAGIAIATAMLSALTGRAVRHDVAMTGEVTLRGRVLPIGGLREKLLAARRSGIKKVLMPHDNEKDLKEVPAEVLEDLEIVFVDHVDEVLPHALAASVEEIFSGRATAQPLYLSLRAGKNDKDSSAAAPQ